jgi:hypothetical protein
VSTEPRAQRALPSAYRAVLAVPPHGNVTEITLGPRTSASAAVTSALGCPQPVRLRLTSRLDMWVTGDCTHRLPLNLLAAGLGLRHGLAPRCYHGTVMLCGTAPGPGPAGLSIDQVLAALTQIADVADGL